MEILDNYFKKLPRNAKLHSFNTSKLCVELGKLYNLDLEFVRVMGLYHDIGYTLTGRYYNINGYEIISELNRELALVTLHQSNSMILRNYGTDIYQNNPLPDDLYTYVRVLNIAELSVDWMGNIINPINAARAIGIMYGETSFEARMANIQVKEINKSEMNTILRFIS